MSLNLDSGALDMSTMSDADKREIQTFIQNESQKASIQESVHQLTAMCWKKCITSKIAGAQLDKYEEPCMQNCVQRFMDSNLLTIRQLERMRTS